MPAAVASSSRAVARRWTAHGLGRCIVPAVLPQHRAQQPAQKPHQQSSLRPASSSAASAQAPSVSDPEPSYNTPYKLGSTSTQIPSFAAYRNRARGETGPKVYQYFMVGTLGALSAMGTKSVVQNFLVNMSASADVLAMAKVEIDLGVIPQGKNVIIKWRGKPVFIRHRTEDEIKEAEEAKWEALRDPQPDSDRVKKPEWLIMLGSCCLSPSQCALTIARRVHSPWLCAYW